MAEKGIKIHQPIIKYLAERHTEGNLVLCIGAGLSAGAGLPTWKEFAEELQRDLGSKGNVDPIMIIEQYESMRGRASLENKTIQLLDDSGMYPSESHSAMVDLCTVAPEASIITTNFDRFIERAFRESGVSIEVFIRDQNLIHNLPDKVKIYKIHGCISDPETMVLSNRDYIFYEKKHPLFLNILKTELIRKTWLFIGFSLSDPNFKQVRNQVLAQLDDRTWIAYAILRKPQPEEEQYLKSQNIQVIGIEEYEEIPLLLRAISEETRKLREGKQGKEIAPLRDTSVLKTVTINQAIEIQELKEALEKEFSEKLGEVERLQSEGSKIKERQKIDDLIARLATDFSKVSLNLKAAAFRAAANSYCEEADEIAKAQDYISMALSLDPGNEKIKVIQAKILAISGQKEKALEILDSLDAQTAFHMKLALLLDMERLNECEKIITENPPQEPGETTYRLLAAYHHLKGNFDEAEGFINQALTSARTLVNLHEAGVIFLEKAIHHFKRPEIKEVGVLINPPIYAPNQDEREALEKACSILKEARALALEWLDLSSQELSRINALLVAGLNLFDPVEALSFAREIILKDPSHIAAIYYLLFQNRFEDKEKSIKTLESKPEKDSFTVEALVLLCLETEQFLKAEKALTAYRHLFSGDAEVKWYELRAGLLRSLGKIDEAFQLIQSYQSLGDPWEKQELLLHHYLEIEDFDKALTLAKEMYEALGRLDTLYIICMILNEKIKRWREAEKYNRQLVKKAPNWNSYRLLLLSLFKLKNYEEILRVIKEAWNKGVDHIGLDRMYGLALFALRNFQKALPYLEKAYEFDKKEERVRDPDFTINLAYCYLNIGKEAQGIAVLEELAHSSASIPQAYIDLL